MNWLQSNESKGIFLSLLIHSTLLGAVMLHEKEPMKLADKEKTISIDLISYPPPKPIEEVKPKPEPEPKKVEKPKPKPKPKTKPIVHKKPEPIQPKEIEKPKPEPVKKEVKEAIKEVEKPQNTTHNKQAQRQAFIKTNFAIIRDMVLSNLHYPNIAKRMGWVGVVEVELVISKSGKLLEYSIYKSSGKQQLDQAALKAVESIKKHSLPKPQRRTTLILPIGFQLN